MQFQRLKSLNLRMKTLIQRRPITTNTALCGVFGLSGDAFCQCLENSFRSLDEKKAYNLRRSLELGTNATLYGPFMYYWYRWLDQRYPTRSPRHIACKIGIDLSVALIWYPIFLGTLQLLKNTNPDKSQRKTMAQLKADLVEKIPVLLTFDVVLWPVFQWLNFRFLSSEFRVVGTKCSEFSFDVIISWVANNDVTLDTLVQYIKGSILDNGKTK